MNLSAHSFVFAAAAVILTASVASAQGNVKAEIPFSFEIGKSKLPAGPYSLVSNGQYVQIRNLNTRQSIIAVPAVSASQPGNNAEPHLVFHKYGDHYFLSQVWADPSAPVRTFGEGPFERELRAGSRTSPESVVVALAK
jgi:hypothetical protein